MVGVALEGERRGDVPGESLESADDLAALREEREAPMPKALQTPLRVAARLLPPLVQGVRRGQRGPPARGH